MVDRGGIEPPTVPCKGTVFPIIPSAHKIGSPAWARTTDILINSQAQLPTVLLRNKTWCERRDSNSHDFRHWLLRPAWLPLHHSRILTTYLWSQWLDSNQRYLRPKRSDLARLAYTEIKLGAPWWNRTTIYGLQNRHNSHYTNRANIVERTVMILRATIVLTTSGL